MKNIKLSDYTYHLPAGKIATHGLAERDQAKLLLYKGSKISHHIFHELPGLLPANTTLFFNDTKVIQARLFLQRKSGAKIEVFLLSPAAPGQRIEDTLNTTGKVTYHCLIGNLKKWPEDETLLSEIAGKHRQTLLKVRLVNKEKKLVEFSWENPTTTFGEIISQIGHMPLPPYIKRADEEADKERYQTVYSKCPGAVAAPTAGLHFTGKVLQELSAKGIKTDFLTLHVSAGTFQPIKVDDVSQHPMHNERIIINKTNLQNLLAARHVTAVGTTALRTLESTYWYGVQLLTTGSNGFTIARLTPYGFNQHKLPSRKEALARVLAHLEDNQLDAIEGNTEIFIMPGYTFKVCDGLITNFHQPGSTLILLVAAFVGNNWQKIYQEALTNDYRFLSYGDSSLLLR